jgi:hypothetical protein
MIYSRSRPRQLKNEVDQSVDQWSQIRMTLMRSYPDSHKKRKFGSKSAVMYLNLCY